MLVLLQQLGRVLRETSQWLLCAGLSYLVKAERLSDGGGGELLKTLPDDTTPDAIFPFGHFLKKREAKVKLH